VFSNQAYDSLITVGNSVVTYSKRVDSEGNILEYSSNPITYYLNTQNKIEKITKTFNNSNLYEYSYIYSGDSIQEMINDSILGRTFYYNVNNLAKVVTKKFNTQGKLISKKEMLFENYDQNPNPLKNHYYLPGAFFRAFSNNNYKSLTIQEYGNLNDSTFDIISTTHIAVTISYDGEGYPIFGEYY
jgi:hypothetical protein